MRWSALAMLALFLAGCSGRGAPGDDAGTGEDVRTSPLAAGGNATLADAGPLNGTTDTLFLASPTRLNATGLANLTVLATLAGASPQTLAWNATLNGTGNVSHARLRLWLDLQASAVQTGVGGDPACSAALTLLVTHNGTTRALAGGCASLGTGLVPPGEHLLDLGSPLAPLALQPGDRVLAQVSFGLSFPQGVAYVLGGGERASALVLAGLAEPVRA